MTDEWITDRQPTKEDGDVDGEVLMQRYPNWRSLLVDTSVYAGVAYVGPGVPWKHTSIWRTPVTSEPEPEAPAPELWPELKVGQVWQISSGGRLTVRSVDGDRFRVTDEQGFDWVYQPDALIPGRDLVALITDAPAESPQPEPEPTTRKVPRLFARPIRRTLIPSGGTMMDALADDGTCWEKGPGDLGWKQVPPLPDREEPIDA